MQAWLVAEVVLKPNPVEEVASLKVAPVVLSSLRQQTQHARPPEKESCPDGIKRHQVGGTHPGQVVEHQPDPNLHPAPSPHLSLSLIHI